MRVAGERYPVTPYENEEHPYGSKVLPAAVSKRWLSRR